MYIDFTIVLSVIAILISVIVAAIHFKNRKTMVNSYLISKDSHSRNSFDFLFIESEQLENSHIVKLAVFNPSSTSLLLKCLKVYKRKKIENKVSNFFGFYTKWELIDSRWWPSDEFEFMDERFLNQEYENLLVSDTKNVFVAIGGLLDSRPHKFELITSFGIVSHISTINGSQISFNIDFTYQNNF